MIICKGDYCGRFFLYFLIIQDILTMRKTFLPKRIFQTAYSDFACGFAGVNEIIVADKNADMVNQMSSHTKKNKVGFA